MDKIVGEILNKMYGPAWKEKKIRRYYRPGIIELNLVTKMFDKSY